MSQSPTTHLSAEQISKYRARELSASELIGVSDHLLQCPSCRSEVVSAVEIDAAFERIRGTLSGHLTNEELASYADGLLDAGQREHIEQHANGCPECSRDLEAYRLVASSSEVTSRPNQMRESWWRWMFGRPGLQLRMAASAAALASVAVVVWIARDQKSGPAPVVSSTPSPVTPAPPREILRDGRREIQIAASGEMTGLEELPEAFRESVKATLLAKRVTLPNLSDLRPVAQTLVRGASSRVEAGVRLLSPIGTVVESDAPVFRWRASGSGEYRVSVVDEQFRTVAESDWLSAAQWRPKKPLARGRRYSWQVTTRRDGAETISPAPPAPEARFQVLGSAEWSEVQRMRTEFADSPLLLALVYARVGLLSESESELRKFSKDNPNSTLASDLVSSLPARDRSGAR